MYIYKSNKVYDDHLFSRKEMCHLELKVLYNKFSGDLSSHGFPTHSTQLHSLHTPHICITTHTSAHHTHTPHSTNFRYQLSSRVVKQPKL